MLLLCCTAGLFEIEISSEIAFSTTISIRVHVSAHFRGRSMIILGMCLQELRWVKVRIRDSV
jgi:hypothetical protein